MRSKLLTAIVVASPLLLATISAAGAADSLKLLANVNSLVSQDANDPPPPPPPPPPKPITNNDLGPQSEAGAIKPTTRR